MMERYGYSIFCDEIRNEVGGKLSFVGCYNAIMFTAKAFPITLPKFCIHFHVFSPVTQPYESLISRCYVPGQTDPVAEEAVGVPTLHDQMSLLADLPGNGGAPPCIVVAASLVFTPFEIPEPGMIQIRALINGGPGELQVGSLTVAPAMDAIRGDVRSDGDS
jgi:hypothetical protein